MTNETEDRVTQSAPVAPVGEKKILWTNRASYKQMGNLIGDVLENCNLLLTGIGNETISNKQIKNRIYTIRQRAGLVNEILYVDFHNNNPRSPSGAKPLDQTVQEKDVK